MTRIRDLIKRRDKDFVILNITDIQFNDTLDKFDGKKFTSDTVCTLVERVKPDLITVSGDFVWGHVRQGFTQIFLYAHRAIPHSVGARHRQSRLRGQYEQEGDCRLYQGVVRVLSL